MKNIRRTFGMYQNQKCHLVIINILDATHSSLFIHYSTNRNIEMGDFATKSLV